MSRLESLRDAMAQSPDNVALLLLFGHACLDEIQLDEAHETFSRILNLDPGQLDAQLGLARTLVLQGDTSAAAVRAERILQRNPHSAPAHLLLSRIHLTENHRDRALEHFRRAIEIDSSANDPALEADLGKNVRPSIKDRSTSPLDLLDEPEPYGEVQQDFPEESYDDPPPFDWRPETFFAPGDNERLRVTFSDVGGMASVKEEIRLKIIYPLQHAELYKAYGRKTGGGILLYGPPGCGKTLMLRATAGEAGCNYLAVGLHEIFDPYYGSIERNVHQIFETARENTPCVLVFDELDSLAPDRRTLRDSQVRNVVNQFLSELDGIRSENQRILVIGATNAPWQLDPALRRPGRFDQAIFVPPPDITARIQIIRLLAKDKPIAELDEQALAAATEGFSGADLKWVFERAAEVALVGAIHAGRIVPISMASLLEVARSHSPGTRDWIEGLQQDAPAAKHDALYNEMRKFFQIAPKSR